MQFKLASPGPNEDPIPKAGDHTPGKKKKKKKRVVSHRQLKVRGYIEGEKRNMRVAISYRRFANSETGRTAADAHCSI